MEHNKAASSFVVQIAPLVAIDHFSGASHYGPEQILAVADSLEEARQVAVRFPTGPGEVRILEVFQPVDVGGGSLRFLAPIRRAVVEPKAKPVRKARKAA
jgi:hypothetical protein